MNLYQYNKKIVPAALFVVFMSVLMVWVGFNFSQTQYELYPQNTIELPWASGLNVDTLVGGQSEGSAHLFGDTLSLGFTLREGYEYPFITWGVYLEGEGAEGQKYGDLSAYSGVMFSVRCEPSNILVFVVSTFDVNTKPENLNSYRVSEAFFSCDDQWRVVDFRFDQLKVPRWWLSAANRPLSDQQFDLSKVDKLAISSSHQSPKGVESQVQIKSLTLIGSNWLGLCGLGLVIAVLWGAFGYWVVRSYTVYIEAKAQAAMKAELVPMRSLPVARESKSSKEQNALFEYIAKEYVNPDINVERVMDQLGLNRSKINDILKQSVGMTFSAYIKRLRLTEAARLLGDDKMMVSEVAYAVGYNNPSYFNTLFKNAYGYTPKAFKKRAALKKLSAESKSSL